MLIFAFLSNIFFKLCCYTIQLKREATERTTELLKNRNEILLLVIACISCCTMWQILHPYIEIHSHSVSWMMAFVEPFNFRASSVNRWGQRKGKWMLRFTFSKVIAPFPYGPTQGTALIWPRKGRWERYKGIPFANWLDKSNWMGDMPLVYSMG